LSRHHAENAYDVIVVGGGIFGLSVAWEAARRGRRTLLLERRQVPNRVAASYGPSRKIRSTYLEPHYARLACEAIQAWSELQAAVGGELYVQTGNLSITRQDEQPELDALEAVARSIGAQIEVFDRPRLGGRFPQFKRARRALFETEAGFLRATACVEAISRLALEAGVVFAIGQETQAIEPSGLGLAVTSGQNTYYGTQVVVATGGWSNRLLPELGQALWQCQQGLLYVRGVPHEFGRPAFVPFSCLDEGYYGFPSEPAVGLKVAQHSLNEPIKDPDFDRSTLPPGFLEGVSRFLRDELGLDVARYGVTHDSCMYNLSHSGDFLLDFHPRLPGVFLATAGSGHGFKFGPLIGKIVMDRLDGQSSDRWDERFSYESFISAAQVARPL
jgi:monomeric sarcosine oxidase